MAYGLKHRITFIGRQFSNDINDQYYLNIYEKDYAQVIHSLMGANPPFVVKFLSGDDPFPIGIRASECEANYFNDGSWPLLSFYSEDDEKYRFDFYSETVENVVVNKLIWSGYLVQDNCEEQFRFPPYVVTLKGTDNLGLLKEVPLNVAFEDSSLRELYEAGTSDVVISSDIQIAIQLALVVVSQDLSKLNILVYGGLEYHITSASFDAGTHILTLTTEENFPANGSFASQEWSIYTTINIFSKVSLFNLLQVCLEKTGIILPLKLYTNIYENTTDDRGDVATATFFEQTRILVTKYQKDDGTFEDCYKVLDELLRTFNCMLSQSEGYWTVVRWPEAIFFTDNAITGTEYLSDFTTPITTTLQPEVSVDQDGSIGIDVIPINATHMKRITRPYKTVKETFNYEQPASLIIGNNLDRYGVLLSSTTEVIDDVTYRFDNYELPTEWQHVESDSSYITIVTDITSEPYPVEKERYVTSPSHPGDQAGVQLNYIEVSKGDLIDFSLQFKTEVATGDFFRFWIEFDLYGVDGTNYVIAGGDTGTGSFNLAWTELLTPFSLGINMYIPDIQDTSEFVTWSLSSFTLDDNKKLLIPEDGMLKITVWASNGVGGDPHPETMWNDIRLTITNYINNTTKIIGQYHLQTQDNDAKNLFDEEIFLDDSPRNTIAGTLFTNEVTTFTDIGNIYFTRTQNWHRLTFSESLRLGQLTTYERKFMYSKARTSLEGDFFFVRYSTGTYRFISLANIIKIGPLPGLNFIIGPLTIDFFAAVWSATLFELYNDGDAEEFIYTFKYITETT